MMRRVLNMHSMDSLAEEEEYVAATQQQEEDDEEEEEEEEMPPEARMWRSVIDPASGKMYYYHIATRESQWEKPLVLCSARERAEVVRRGEQERYFFAEMECNIRRKIQQGLLFADASGIGTTRTRESSSPTSDGSMTHHIASSREAQCAEKSNARGQLEPRPPERLWRTISTVDEHRVVAELCASSPLENARHFSAIETIANEDSGVPPHPPCNSGGSFDSSGSGGGNSSPPSLAPLAPVWTASCPAASRRYGDTFSASSEASAAVEATTVLGASRGGGSGAGVSNLSAAGELAGGDVRFRERGVGDMGMADPGGVHGNQRTEAKPLHHLPPHLVRRNSTSTVYTAANDTMSDPDLDATIRCVCAVLRAHMIEAMTKGPKFYQQREEPSLEVGAGAGAAAAGGRTGWKTTTNRQHEGDARGGGRPDTQWIFERIALFDDSPPYSSSGENSATERASRQWGRGTVVPSLREITAYFRHLYHRARLKFDCIVVSLIYVERLMKETRGALRPLPFNWKSLVMSTLLLSSKVWDDHSMWNRDFSELCPMFTLVRLNQLEVAVLELLRFNVKVLSSEYAKYYFHLRSMCVRGGLSMDHAPIHPLDMEDVRVLEDLSSKLEVVSGGQRNYPGKSTSSRNVNDAKLLQKVSMSGYAFPGKYAP